MRVNVSIGDNGINEWMWSLSAISLLPLMPKWHGKLDVAREGNIQNILRPMASKLTFVLSIQSS